MSSFGVRAKCIVTRLAKRAIVRGLGLAGPSLLVNCWHPEDEVNIGYLVAKIREKLDHLLGLPHGPLKPALDIADLAMVAEQFIAEEGDHLARVKGAGDRGPQ